MLVYDTWTIISITAGSCAGVLLYLLLSQLYVNYRNGQAAIRSGTVHPVALSEKTHGVVNDILKRNEYRSADPAEPVETHDPVSKFCWPQPESLRPL